MNQYEHNEFSEEYTPTTMTEFYHDKVRNVDVTLQLWDNCGADRCRHLTHSTKTPPIL